MFYKVASETIYEEILRWRKRERESRNSCLLSFSNDLRFTHFLSNWANLFFYKMDMLFNIYSLTKVHFKKCYCWLSLKAIVFKYKIFSETI